MTVGLASRQSLKATSASKSHSFLELHHSRQPPLWRVERSVRASGQCRVEQAWGCRPLVLCCQRLDPTHGPHVRARAGGWWAPLVSGSLARVGCSVRVAAPASSDCRCRLCHGCRLSAALGGRRLGRLCVYPCGYALGRVGRDACTRSAGRRRRLRTKKDRGTCPT